MPETETGHTHVIAYVTFKRQDTIEFDTDAHPDDLGFREVEDAIRSARPFDDFELDDYEADVIA